MKDPKEKREIERSEALDKTAKTISSLIPGGGTVYETYRALVTPLHEKKAKEWQQEVIKRLAKLEKEGKIDLEKLSEDEEFNTIITRATVLTLQNHQEEKLEALRNIVINSAVDDELDFELKHYFLLFIDQISPLHILLLKIFKDPSSYADERSVEIGNMMATSAMSTLFKIMPDLKEREQLVELAWDDLSDMKLVTTNSLKAMTSGNAATQPLTSDLGKKFLDLIEEQEL